MKTTADTSIKHSPHRIEAAAPELLAALQTVVRDVDDFQCGCTVRERDSGHKTDCSMPAILDALQGARAAIAKATGSTD